jgi:hypothetical protein
MMKIVFAFALMASSGTALAYQQQPAPTEEAVPVDEAAEASAEAVDPAVQPTTAVAPEPVAEPDAVSIADAEADYRAAAKAFRKCRQTAQMEGGVGATRSCNSKRDDMIAAREALREGK